MEDIMPIEKRVITPAEAKRLISTYDEASGMDTYAACYTTFITSQKSLPRKRRQVDVGRVIAITPSGELIHGVVVLCAIIERKKPQRLWVCTVTDAVVEKTDHAQRRQARWEITGKQYYETVLRHRVRTAPAFELISACMMWQDGRYEAHGYLFN